MTAARDLVWALSPCGRPDPDLVVAAGRADALGVLDLGTDRARALEALAATAAKARVPFGVRVGPSCGVTPDELVNALPAEVDTIVVAGPDVAAFRGSGRRVVAEVASAADGRRALDDGTDGLVAKGSESAGRVGTTGTFVLLQQLVALAGAGHSAPGHRPVPVWARGGIGVHTVAAAVAGGAAGVVVDTQLALLRGSTLPRPIRAVIGAMDGSETRVVGGHRVYARPDLWVAGLPSDTPAAEVAAALQGEVLTGEVAVPVGQDGCLAAGFERRWSSVGRAVSGLRTAVDEHLAAAERTRPLAPGNGVARDFRTALPVVQGPMTRVSDTAAFAEEVAGAGGMPFLALALLRGPQVRDLLTETRERLGERPWGVGILGFVPKDLRDEQLEVIRDLKPPAAIIAGGRPSQAAPLEAEGITTYLHVPAPGLLERFLKDGARRFVLEGFECGGHVGPRSSFVLWESQVETLLAFGRLDGVHVLFAGGIHDARSAGMVAALAGPLVEAGARVGVVMGTAYLFTEEIVRAGAIGEEFQAQAIACDTTVLLETAPGHATRCAATPYVDTFESTRRHLVAGGADHGTVWAELESLNIGRLRLASKGIKREGDDLVSAGVDEQRRDGMYMIGDVATLHDRVMPVAELHARVTEGAADWVAAAAGDRVELVERTAGPEPIDIAIVGMACVMPGADDLEAFWSNVVDGVSSVTEVPPERWDPGLFWDPEYDHATAHKDPRVMSASKWGGFINPIEFDALAYGIPPGSLGAIEPNQLLSLKMANDALADAGYGTGGFDRSRTAVVYAVTGGTDQASAYSLRATLPAFVGDLPPELDRFLPAITEDSFPGMLPSVVAGRITNRLDLGGKNLVVDAACASSLAALDVACADLVSGASDMVLCGGADLHNGVHDFQFFTSCHALSTTGRCSTFDASADGIALGEGVGCLVLKRLDDAERDGDRVYAVIKSVQGASDGRHLGLTAPRQEGQERSVRRAYAAAGMSPTEVGLVEAHGTGTVVGDRTELRTLTSVFGEAGALPGTTVLGSVKSNIGHTKCAAGIAGLIKAAKAIHHGVLPPTLNIEQPNPGWDPETSPFVFLDEARPWLDERRAAGVSAFGFGGTNFHVVLTQHAETPAPAAGREQWPAELFAFRGTSDADVDRELAALAARLDEEVSAPLRTSRFRLRDIAAAVSTAGHGPVRLALVAVDVDDLAAKVATARAGSSGAGVYRAADLDDLTSPEDAGWPPTVGFLFPGQGSQRPGMVADLLATFPGARSVLSAGERWAATMLPRAAFGAEAKAAQRAALTDTRAAQPALGIAGLTVARVLSTLGVAPEAVGGHSFGELVALCAAGALDEDALLRLAEERAEAILAAAGDDPGTMAAASASRDKVEAVLGDAGVVVANDNHPEQVVIAGPTAAVDDAVRQLEDHGISAKRIPVACAFHSPVVAGAADRLAGYLDGVELRPPVVPVWANTTAEVYPDAAEGARALIARQVAEGVRFTDEIRAMYAAGVRVFVEVGPGRVLTGLVARTLSGQPHLAVATDRPGGHGVTALLQAVAQLAVAGVAVDLDALHAGRDSDPRRWTDPAKRAMWAVDGHRVRQTRDGQTVPGGVKAATETPHVPMGAAATAGPAALGNGANPIELTPADHVVLQYLQTTNNLIETGRQVILGYLGAPVAAATALGAGDASVDPAVLSALAGGAAAPVVSPGTGGVGLPSPGNGHGVAPVASPAVAGGLARAAALLADPDALLARLVGIVAARTGYPADMLDPDLDVEADLSIDSIKRMEILAELADEIGLSDDGNLDQLEDLVEDLAKNKTLRSIVGFLVSHADRLTDGATPDAGALVVSPSDPARTGGARAAAMLADPDRLLGRLIEIVAARTGYPTDMLDPDLDVEADLSIDSIKRMEILAELADEIGLSDDGNLDQLEDLVEDLAKNKTLRSIVGFLVGHAHMLTGGPAPEPAPEPAPVPVAEPAAGPAPVETPSPTGNGATGTAVGAPRIATTGEFKLATNGNIGGLTGTAPIPDHCYRYTIGVKDLPPVADPALPVGPVTVTGDGPVAEAVAAELAGRGVEVRRTTAGDAGLCGTVVFADLVDPAPPTVVDLFPPLKRVLVEGSADVVFLSALGGGMGIDPPAPRTFEDPVPTGAGARALVKTSGIEYPDRVVRLVDLDPAELADAPAAARLVVDELGATGAPAEVGRRDGRRLTSEVVRLHGRPPGTEPVDLTPLGLTKDSVVLFTGGARGITALVAVELARKTGCTIELSGRSPLPADDEEPALAGATDRRALRGALVGQGWRDFKAIDKETDRILAAREVRATLRALEEAGSTVHYHQVDVRDHEALSAVVRSVYERRGRLDGVIAGAGIMKDALLEAKSPEVFRDVYATKVDSLRTILQSIGHDLGFLVVFSSVVGHTGNRGQVDYTTANDALDTITRANVDRARRVLVVDWGPWDSALGMIYDELGKVLESVGIGLVAPEDGIGCLLGDLAHTTENQLMVVRAEPDLVGARDDGPDDGPDGGPDGGTSAAAAVTVVAGGANGTSAG